VGDLHRTSLLTSRTFYGQQHKCAGTEVKLRSSRLNLKGRYRAEEMATFRDDVRNEKEEIPLTESE
jgi:hypothetical protein